MRCQLQIVLLLRVNLISYRSLKGWTGQERSLTNKKIWESLGTDPHLKHMAQKDLWDFWLMCKNPLIHLPSLNDFRGNSEWQAPKMLLKYSNIYRAT